MKKVIRSLDPGRRVSPKLVFGSFGETALRLRWVVVSCATLACLGLFAARNGAQQVDSGWAVAIPSPLATGATNTAEQELIIRHAIEETRLPLLRKPESAPANPAKNANTDRGLRFAVRPEATTIDGWRPSALSLGPANDNSTTQGVAPQAGAGKAPSKLNFETECDCSGTTDAAARKKAVARLPVVPEPSLPKGTTPTVVDETPANPPIEEASKDGEPATPPGEENSTTPAES